MPKPSNLKVFNKMLYAKIDIEKARQVACDIIYDDAYIYNLKRRAIAGVLAPAMERMLWYYVFGKPQDTVNVNITDNRVAELKQLSQEELLERAQVKIEKIRAKKLLVAETVDKDSEPSNGKVH